MSLNHFLISFDYISGFPYFWVSMGFVSAISMITMVMLFDHHLGEIKRSLTAKIIFIFLLFWVTLNRIGNIPGIVDIKKAYASSATLIIVSIFWFIGAFFGILFIYLFKERKKHLNK